MIEIVQSLDHMRSLEHAWNELAEPFGTPLLRHEWFAACAEIFCPPAQLSIVVVSSGGNITAIAPLILSRQDGLERLELLGASHLYEHGGFIYADEESFREAVDAIVAMRKPIFLNRLRQESSEFNLLQQVGKERALCFVRQAEDSPWLHITEGWPCFEANISSSRRSAFRRARKRAEEHGKVRFEIVSPDLGLLERQMEEVFRVEAAGWKDRNKTSMASNMLLKKFFSLYAQATARLGMLRLCFFRINNMPVAMLLGVEYANRFWVLKVGYDESFAKCSPGILLTHETIRYAFERGLEAYEFLGDNEEWLQIWADKMHSHASFRIYPFSLRGAAALAKDAFHAIICRVPAVRK